MKSKLNWIIIIGIFVTNGLLAGPIVWTGAGDGTSWEDGANWDTGVIPDASSEVEIVSGNVTINSGTNAVSTRIEMDGTFTIESGASLHLNGVPASMQYGFSMAGAGDVLNIEGSLHIENHFVGLVGEVCNITVGALGTLTCNTISASSIFIDFDPNAAVVNHGAISIEGVFGQSLRGRLTNTGTIEITGSTGPNVLMNNSGTIDLTDMNSGMNLRAGSNVNSGMLLLDSLDFGTGLTLSDDFIEFTNSGTIQLNAPSFRGLRVLGNSCEIENTSTGVISVVGASLNGILIEESTTGTQSFTNSGTIILDQIGEDGLVLSDTDFDHNGSLTITNIADEGIVLKDETDMIVSTGGTISIVSANEGIEGIDNSSLRNNGTIFINAMVESGIYIFGFDLINETGGAITVNGANIGVETSFITDTLSNSGQFSISNTTLRGVDMGLPNHVFENKVGGVVNMQTIGTSAIVSKIENAGTINVSNGCTNVAFDGDTENSGQITMTNITNGGISGSLENTGTVSIDGAGATGINVYSGKTFTNSGTITAANISGTKISVNGSGASWSNSGAITITGGSGNGLSFFQSASNSQTFSGSISMTGGNLGIAVNDCALTLAGNISLVDVTSGVSSNNEADFTLASNGILNISNCDRGFLASLGSINEIEGGLNIIGTIATDAISVKSGATLDIFSTGIVKVDKSGLSSIVVDNGQVRNFGEMNFRSDFTAISNLGDFQNKTNGTIKILGFGNVGITNGFGGTFTNEGILDITKDGSPVDIQNIDGGMMVNSGTIIARK